MTKRTKILSAIFASIILIPILILTVWYQVYKQRATDQPPSFDLFIAETFFEQDDSSPWDIVPESEKRPIEWQLDSKQFEKLDTVVLALTNKSGEKFYYTSCGAPFTRFRQDMIVYRNGIGDTIPFGGFGCGTGVYAAPLKDSETMTRTIYNPLMLNPYSNYDLAIESDSFPSQFREIYGDSVAIMFSQATYSNPWNKYKSQMVFSDYITVSTGKILENWSKGKFARLPETEPTMEEHFGLKKFGQ
jgi:hypothetical protein